MILDSTTRKLQVLLSSAIVTNNSPITVNYSDTTTTTFTPGLQLSNTNGVSAVDIVSAPNSGVQRKINFLSIFNADTVPIVVTLRFNDNGTTYEILKTGLAVNQALVYVDQEGWSLSPGINDGRYVSFTLLTAGTTSYVAPAGITKILLRLQGAGGAGGGGSSVSVSAAVGGGGGAGGYAEKLFYVTPGTTYSCTVGTGGTAGTAGNNPGNNGGNTTFTVGSTTVTAFGGSGGQGMAGVTTVSSAAGGAGGVVSTNGDVNAGGEPGNNSQVGSGTLACSGRGGTCIFGAGGQALNAQGTGNGVVGRGGGGSGGCTLNGGAATAGGAGGDGLIMVWEHY